MKKNKTINKDKLNYFEIEEESPIYELLNKCIVDSVLTQLPEDATEQENQDIYNLRLPKTRHKTLAFFNKFFNSAYHWSPWEKVATNHKYILKNGILNILVRKNISKDTNLIYLTTADEILELQKMGLTKSQALTSIVIEIAGKYKTIVAERQINSQITTNKTDLKLSIVDSLQRHAKLLQPIERHINNELHNEHYFENTKLILQEYKKQLQQEITALEAFNLQRSNNKLSPELYKQLQIELGLNDDVLEHFLSYDSQYLMTLEQKRKAQLQDAQNFIYSMEGKSAPQINDHLQGFLRQQLNDLVHNAQAENDQITHNSDDSFLRGKLRECLMDADKAVCNYVFDQHNPITKEHQLDFSTDKDGGKAPAAYHSRIHVGHSSKDLERALIGITYLNSKSEQEIREVKSASWNNFSKHTKDQKLKRFAAWSLTTIAHLPLALVNTLVAALTNKAPVARLMQFIETKINNLFNIKEYYHHDFYKYQAKLGVNNVYTSTSVGKMLNKAVREVTGVVLQSPQVIYNKAREQFQLFKKDLQTGLWGHLYYQNKEKVVVEEVNKDEINNLFNQEQFKLRLEKIIANAKTYNQLSKLNFTPLQFAKPKNPLEPYEPHDILSSAITGLEGFMNFFKNDIFEKHPMTALVASVAYIVGGAAVLSPATLSLILTKIGLTSTQITHVVTSSTAIGKALAHGTESEAIAAGFTLAKIVGVSANTLSEGFDSALFAIINEIRKDPMIYSMGLAIAYAFGHMVTDVVHIPAVTDYLREEVGNVPALAKILIGAKLGIISLESALPEDEEHKSILAHFVGDVAKMLLLSVRLVASVGTLSLQPWKDLKLSCIRGLGILSHSVNRLVVMTGQHFTQIPKTFIEAGSTLAVNALKLGNLFTRPFRSRFDHSVIGAGPLLRAKEKAFHAGYKAGFFIREHTSRKAERFYGGYITGLNHKDENEKANTTTKLLSKLQSYSKEEADSKQKQPEVLLELGNDSNAQDNLQIKSDSELPEQKSKKRNLNEAIESHTTNTQLVAA